MSDISDSPNIGSIALDLILVGSIRTALESHGELDDVGKPNRTAARISSTCRFEPVSVSVSMCGYCDITHLVCDLRRPCGSCSTVFQGSACDMCDDKSKGFPPRSERGSHWR